MIAVLLILQYPDVLYADLSIRNGWFADQSRPVWGLSEYSDIWKPHRRPSLIKHDPSGVGPNRTENLERLSDSMVKHGFPVFEHNPGLWYDGRRRLHGRSCKKDGNIGSPYYEMPWARSGTGRACDGLSKYDLESFNHWYFSRIGAFARLSARKGLVLRYNYYLQHNLLEEQTHYVDFPWRPGNSIQDTGLPDQIPVANQFFDPKNSMRRKLHRLYIKHVLDTLGPYRNVVHFAAAEYTGNAEFQRFWMDEIVRWEHKHPHRDIYIGLAAPKGVMDEILRDPRRSRYVDVIDLRYFWYRKDGSLAAIPGGGHIAGGRFFDGEQLHERSSPQWLYKQTLEYRSMYPDKVIFHAVSTDLDFILPFLMAGGSVNSAKLDYGKNKITPESYIAPVQTVPLQPLHDFITWDVGEALLDMSPDVNASAPAQGIYALSSDHSALILVSDFTPGQAVKVSLGLKPGSYNATWFSPDSGEKLSGFHFPVGGGSLDLSAPESGRWLLFLTETNPG